MPLNNDELSQLWNYHRRIQNESAFPTLVYRLIEQLPGRLTGRLQREFNTLLQRWRNQPTRANSDNLFNWINRFRHHTPLYDHFYDYMMAPTYERRSALENIPRANEETEIENNSAESEDEDSTISADPGDIGDIESGDEEDGQNGNGRNPYALLEQKGHEGKFTAQFKARKPHLRHLKTLGEFAHYILTHPTEFNKISKQRANYYRNLIERKGGMFKSKKSPQEKRYDSVEIDLPATQNMIQRQIEINQQKKALTLSHLKSQHKKQEQKKQEQNILYNLKRREYGKNFNPEMIMDNIKLKKEEKINELYNKWATNQPMTENEKREYLELTTPRGNGRKKGGMFKKNPITKLKEEFNELWNKKIRILQGLNDYILDKIEDNRGLLQASQLYDEYKNTATEVLRQSSELIRQLNNLKRDVLETDGMTEENKRTLILNKIGKLRGLSEEISNVKSEYDDIWKSIIPRARTANRTMGESIVTALPFVSADYDYVEEEDDLPEKLLRENRAISTTSSISPSIEVPTMSSQPLRSMPIDRLIQTFQEQSVNGNNPNQALINELTQIQNTMHATLSQDQRVDESLKRHGFGRLKRGGLSKKMMKDLRAYHRQVGGKISTKDFNLMLKETYKKPQDRDKHIGDYYIDESLSTPENVVYHNPKTGETKVAYRGTEGTLKDWGNNALYTFGLHNRSKRYKRSNDIQKQVEQKYGTQNLDVLGHSQSGAYAQEIGKNAKNVIVLNPATHPGYTPKTKNTTVVRSTGDAVSGLKYLNPLNWGKKKTADVEIKAETYNPVTEHMPNILERLPEDQILGNGRKRKVNKKLRRLCNCCGAKCIYCR